MWAYHTYQICTIEKPNVHIWPIMRIETEGLTGQKGE